MGKSTVLSLPLVILLFTLQPRTIEGNDIGMKFHKGGAGPVPPHHHQHHHMGVKKNPAKGCQNPLPLVGKCCVECSDGVDNPPKAPATDRADGEGTIFLKCGEEGAAMKELSCCHRGCKLAPKPLPPPPPPQGGSIGEIILPASLNDGNLIFIKDLKSFNWGNPRWVTMPEGEPPGKAMEIT